MKTLQVADRQIGADHPVFIIAEAGVNHNGDLSLAKRLIDVAADAGADAVKFQTFMPEAVASRTAPKAAYQRQTTDEEESQLQMLRRLMLSPEAHSDLKNHALSCGIFFLSTPFDRGSVDLLDDLGLPLFKIGSGEVTNLPFVEYIAQKGRPIIASTGMSYLSEVDEMVRAIRRTGNEQFALLHCVSNYPADPDDLNLRVIPMMARVFHAPIGYSDHTAGTEASLAAVALGACIIEKHVTLDRTMPGPDHRASMEPDMFRDFVRSIRTVERSLGNADKMPAASELEHRTLVRRALVAACDITEGSYLHTNMLQALRPATGISPAWLEHVVGRRTRRSLTTGEAIDWSDLA